MFTGFLKVGDVEIINDARAKGYAETAECPLSWHQCDCEGLADATGPGAFVHANVHDAPWYDPRNPESERFYGVTGLAFRDLASSTLQRDVVEGITNGGVAGQSRYAGKTVRVRAFLSADGMDALEYGMSWIKAALANRRCAQHDYSCGGTEAEFFVDCPPARRIVPGFSEWETQLTNLATNPSFEATAGTVEVYRNLATNPSFETASGVVEVRRNTHRDPRATSNSGFSGSAGPGGSVTVSANTGSGLSSPAVDTYVRGVVATAGSLGDIRLTYSTDLPGVPQTTFAVYARTSGPVTSWSMGFTFYDATGAVVGTYDLSYADLGSPIGAGVWSRLAAPLGSVPANAVRADVGVRPVGAGRAVGTTVDITAIITEANESADALRPYFDGATASTSPDFTIGWAGAANNSASVMLGVGAASVSGATTSVRSSEWSASGSQSLRVIPSKSAADPAFPNAATVYTVTEAGRMTVLATARLAAAQVLPVSNGRRIIAHTGTAIKASSSAAPNAAGVYPLRLTFDAAVGDTIRLTSGGIPGSGDVWWDDLLIIKGDYLGTYFDGGTTVTDPDLTASWAGVANASASTMTAPSTPGAVSANTGNHVVYSSKRWAKSGARSVRITPVASTPEPGGVHALTFAAGDVGKTFTAIATIHLDAPLTGTLLPQSRRIALIDQDDYLFLSDAAPNVAGDTTLRLVFAVTASGQTLNLIGGSAAGGGDVWWDDLLVVEGSYDGSYFDGDTPDSNGGLIGYAWTGAADASTSVMQTRYIYSRPQTDAEYFPEVDAVTRVLHGVSAISGPLEVETVQSSDGRHWGREVEFTLYSEQPGIYSKPRSLGTLVSIGEVVDDVVRNLVPYPSAELSQNKVIVAYNHVTNPSLEVADVNWSGGSFSGSDTPGSPAIGAISRGVVRGARAYAGEASYLTRWLGDGKTVGSGRRELGVEYEQRSMPGLAVGDRVTVTVWGALVVQSGTPITAAETLSASFQWVDANGKAIDGASLGTATGEERGGKVFSLSKLVVPAGTTGLRIHLSTNSMDVYSSPNAAVNRDIRVYADAAGVIEEI